MSVELELLSASDARMLTDRIKTGVEAVWQLVKQAYEQRAWDALGYSSWDDYCTREFGTSRLRLPREERAEVVVSLRESGLSIRAIASATNEPVMTVQNELARGVRNRTPVDDPESDAVEMADTAECIHCGDTLPLAQLYEGGQGYECDPCVSPDDGEPVVSEGELPSPSAEPTPAPKPVTGLDGKTYPSKPTAPKEPRRKPITDAFNSASYDLRKATERVVRLTEDDRFAKNKNQIMGANLDDLVRVRDVLVDIIQQLEG